ncbi:C6 zinc finger domain protein [Aspergillus avenaceus]|uniref:C6 zinc finger domain protein n=1 Tax=Aspergillus avenaceus TaxID=36643 RepID=A0A5N6TKD8_ASPAV|nr:C6 zinc finger domain protein [Aspergillus avenaceus]
MPSITRESAMVLNDFQKIYDDGTNAVTQSKMTRPTVVRKKFAKPPVKVACLACRASRTRCDGQVPCSNCSSKKRKCSYLPSKRGGPRKKKRTSVSADESVQQELAHDATIPPPAPGFDESTGMFGQIDGLSVPGAGLRSLDFPSDVHSMFADLFIPDEAGHPPAPMEPTPSPSSTTTQSLVRTYSSEHDILNAYYDFIHNYFPILPPRATSASQDRPLDAVGSYSDAPAEEPIILYKPRSPLSLALSAILALVPHPNDMEPTSAASVIRRRTYAHTFAQMANASIEMDCELNASSTDPSQALSSERPFINRESLHPHAPVELECVLALLILSVYEYTQRGNLLKMRYRAGQALAIALDMSLHALGEEYDEFAEARRRAWWMTYYCVLQGSIVSTTPLAIVANDPQFVTPYPRFAADPDGWAVLMQAQQVLVSATQFIIDLNKCLSTRSNMPYIFERMQQLDTWASSALAQSNLLPIVPPSANCGDGMEYTTAQSIRSISRIKLSSSQIKVHRFRAFSDIPIFIKKHCDLTAANAGTTSSCDSTKNSRMQNGISSIQCSCGGLDAFQQTSSDYTPSSGSSASSDYQSVSQYSFTSGFPFSIQHSAKVCLRAALLISRMFSSLPIPQPIDDGCKSQQNLVIQLPRTMPSFACCLMQGSYAMLMIFYKARVEKQMSQDYSDKVSPSDRLIEELRQGLERIIATVTNYATAFEALDGMRDEIEGAYQTAFPQP